MKRPYLLASGALLLGAAVASAEPPSPPGPTGALVVRVAAAPTPSEKTERPVPGAIVVVGDQGGERRRSTAGSDGAARFAALADGDYTVRVEADRFVAEEKEVSVEDGRQATVSFELSPGVPFDGTVLDDETNQPIAGATIAVEASGSVGGFMSAEFRPPYARTASDAGGRFHVNGVPEGKVATVEVVAPGHCAGAFPLRMLGGHVTPSPVVVRLARGGTFVGVVRGPDGKPVAGATVYVIPAASEELRKNPQGWRMSSAGAREQAATATTGADGTCRVAGLPLDVAYVAMAEAEGFSRSEEAEGLEPSKSSPEIRANLALRPAAALVVRVLDPAGKPVSGAVVVVGSSGGPSEKLEQPNDDGAYRFAGLPPGEWPVSATAPEFRSTWKNVVVEAGKASTVTLTLDPGVSIEGIVVDEDGKPVAGATLTIETVGGNEPGPGGWTTVGGQYFASGPDGRFAAKGLAPKAADVTASGSCAGGEGWCRTSAAVRITPPASRARLVVVRRGSASIRLVTPDGMPFSGEAAMIWDGEKGKGTSGSGRKIENGVVRWNDFGDGDYLVAIDIEGYVTVRREFPARLRKHVDLGTAVLDPGLVVKGRVVDPSGAPVAGARVQSAEAAVATDERGTFTLPHEPRGTVPLKASADGFLDTEQKVEVGPGMAPVEVRIPHGALVQCVLKDAGGAPLEGERLVARPLRSDGTVDLEPGGEWEDTAEGGRAAFRLRPGRWRILYTGTDPEVALGDFTLTEGETREVALKLPK